MTIIVDFGPIKEEQTVLVPGIKLFAKKNKKDDVYVVGSAKDLLTMTGDDNVHVVDADKFEPSRGALENVRDNSLRASLELLNRKKDGEAVLFSFHDKKAVTEAVQAVYDSTGEKPFYGAQFPNAYTGHKTLLADLGFDLDPKPEDFVSYCALAKKMLRKRFGIEEPKVKFLVPANVGKTAFDYATLSLLSKDKDFAGEVTTADMITAECDLLLGHPVLVQAAISGFRRGIEIYDDYISYSSERAVTFKIGATLLKKLFQAFHSGIDRKMVSNGTWLFGYAKDIVLLEKDTNMVGVQGVLSSVTKLLKEKK